MPFMRVVLDIVVSGVGSFIQLYLNLSDFMLIVQKVNSVLELLKLLLRLFYFAFDIQVQIFRLDAEFSNVLYDGVFFP